MIKYYDKSLPKLFDFIDEHETIIMGTGGELPRCLSEKIYQQNYNEVLRSRNKLVTEIMELKRSKCK